MRINLIIIFLAFIACTTWSQQNLLSISGGYSIASLETANANADGWRINGQFEHVTKTGKVSHGLTIGYSKVFADRTEVNGTQTIESHYEVGTVPIYYSPKLLFGNGPLLFYLKGAIGMQFSTFLRTGTLEEVNTSASGFFWGFGPGLKYTLNNGLFLHLEYELASTSDSYYTDTFLHSAVLGVGFQLK